MHYINVIGMNRPGSDLDAHSHRERDWETRAGTVELRIPNLRKGSYFPGFLPPRRLAEKDIVAGLREAYIQGVSTRSVDEGRSLTNCAPSPTY